MRTGQPGPFRAIAAISCILLLQGVFAVAQAAPEAGKPPPKSAGPEAIGVLGDSLGDGLWAGLYRVLRRNKQFTVIKKSKVSSGLTQTTHFNWIDAAKTIEKDEKFQIAVIFLGANDQQALKHDKKWHRFRSPVWTKVYKSRIAALIKVLKKKKLEIYWVGLPVMQKDGFDAGAQFLNSLYRQTAAKHKVPYIDTRAVTAGKNGKYATHYKDGKGRTRLMRADDGVHFTMSGYVGMASHVFARIQAERKKAKAGKKNAVAGAAAGGPANSGVRGPASENPAPPR